MWRKRGGEIEAMGRVLCGNRHRRPWSTLQGQALSSVPMRIGQLAQATGLSRDALRFYEKRGLLTPRRSSNGYRSYPPEAADWLRYVRTAQSPGFTLAE